MEYTGWTLYNGVKVVVQKQKSTYNKYEFPQAYLVDATNKSQLANAIKWGTYNQSRRNENNEYIRDEHNNILYDVIEPDVYTLENSDFTLQLLDSANRSYQGGKQSFWNCIIKHRDMPDCVIGINSDILLCTMLQNTFTNGKCENKVKFARCLGQLGCLTDNMIEYQNALRDMQIKKDVGKGKTTKWQIGQNYVTLTQDDTFIGKFYRPICVTIDQKDTRGSYYNRAYNYKVDVEYNDKENIIYGLIHTDELKDITDLKNYWHKRVYSFKKHAIDTANMNISDAFHYGPNVFCTEKWNLHSKLPARKHGNLELAVPDNYYDFAEEILDKIKLDIIDLIKNKGHKIYIKSIPALFTTTKNKKVDELTDIDKQLLELLTPENLIGYCQQSIEVNIKL